MTADLSERKIFDSPLLIVDDSRITRRKLHTDLTEDGFTDISEAESAEAALNMLELREYDLLLVDMLMPGMDGSELIARLRSDDRFRDIPAIVVTVSEEKDLVRRCFQLGASDFLRKPWDVTDLAARVKAHLERHHALRALSRSEKRFTQAMEASRDGLWEIDIESGRGYFSPGFYRMIGCRSGDFPAEFNAWRERIHPDDLERFDSLIASAFSSGRSHFEVEFRLRHNNSSWNWIRCRANITARNGVGYPTRVVGINEDITSHIITQKTLQKYANEMEQLADQRAKALVHNERLATIGTMSAGIAHEINNPLSFISGNAQMLQKAWPELEAFLADKLTQSTGNEKLNFICEQLPGIIGGINEGVGRITRIVRSMKDFSRKEADEMVSVDIAEPIESALLLCNNSLKHNIEVIKNYTPGQCNVQMRRQQVEQVLINLINNAVQAMNGAGKIFIGVQPVGEYVRITIRDTGPGIPAELIRRIFDPFFTTKPEGIGTGLGLSISKGIAQEHGGNIEVCNYPDSGAEFTLLLPLKTFTLAEDSDSDKQMKILLLEDMDAARQRLTERMRVTGCHILPAQTIQEARQHLLFSRPDALLISYTGGNLKDLAELLYLHDTNKTDSPFFLLSRRTRPELEATYGLNLSQVTVFDMLSSQAIGEVYSAALHHKHTPRNPDA